METTREPSNSGWPFLFLMGSFAAVLLLMLTGNQQPPVITAPQAGRWISSETTITAGLEMPLQIVMDVADDGRLEGQVRLYPPDVPEGAFDLVTNNGCIVEFNSLTGINARYVSRQRARATVTVPACQVRFYGPLALSAPLTAEVVVEYSEAATMAQLAANNTELTPLERGIATYINHCSDCHGNFATGAPGIPSLDSETTRQMTDDELLEVINLGRSELGMPAWGNVLTEEERRAVILVIRDISVLR